MAVPPIASFVVVIEMAGRVRRRPAEIVPVVVPQVGAEDRSAFRVTRRSTVVAGMDEHVAVGAVQMQGIAIGKPDDFRQLRQVVEVAVDADDDAVAAQDSSCSVGHMLAAVADICIRAEVDDPDDVDDCTVERVPE